MKTIFETLSDLGVASERNREVFSEATRDRDDVKVYRDSQSGVIYIDEFYGGDEIYREGAYRNVNLNGSGPRDYEVVTDAVRRSSTYRQYVAGRDIVDFGCGDGAFLHQVKEDVRSCCGIELQSDYVRELNKAGIRCYTSLAESPSGAFDAALSFHVVEHLPDPLSTLTEVFRVLRPGGVLLVEVPHANDLLLNQLRNDSFQNFTLWSQHLVLHTRESLRRLLKAGGFEGVLIEGVQRYPLSNHLSWLSRGTPGGHKTPLSALDTPELRKAYQGALNKIDATDTLVAIGVKPPN